MMEIRKQLPFARKLFFASQYKSVIYYKTINIMESVKICTITLLNLASLLLNGE